MKGKSVGNRYRGSVLKGVSPVFFILIVSFISLAVLLSGCDSGDTAVEEEAVVEEAEKDKPSPEIAQEAAPEPEPEPEPELDVSVFTQKTEYLEYSPKESTDPLGLVSCDDPDIEVTCDVAEVHLAEVGVVDLVYHLSRGTQSKDITLSFVVRDTKAPTVEFVSNEVTIDQGGSIDIRENVRSVTDPTDGALEYVNNEPGKIADTGRQYDCGWYTVTSNLDVNTPGTYYAKVIACDINGNRVEKEYKIVVNEVVVAAPEPEPEPQRNTRRYILNTNTHKFHVPGCSAVDQMAEKNKWDTDEYTREEIIAMGYEPCKRCNP